MTCGMNIDDFSVADKRGVSMMLSTAVFYVREVSLTFTNHQTSQHYTKAEEENFLPFAELGGHQWEYNTINIIIGGKIIIPIHTATDQAD